MYLTGVVNVPEFRLSDADPIVELLGRWGNDKNGRTIVVFDGSQSDKPDGDGETAVKPPADAGHRRARGSVWPAGGGERKRP